MVTNTAKHNTRSQISGNFRKCFPIFKRIFPQKLQNGRFRGVRNNERILAAIILLINNWTFKKNIVFVIICAHWRFMHFAVKMHG